MIRLARIGKENRACSNQIVANNAFGVQHFPKLPQKAADGLVASATSGRTPPVNRRKRKTAPCSQSKEPFVRLSQATPCTTLEASRLTAQLHPQLGSAAQPQLASQPQAGSQQARIARRARIRLKMQPRCLPHPHESQASQPQSDSHPQLGSAAQPQAGSAAQPQLASQPQSASQPQLASQPQQACLAAMRARNRAKRQQRCLRQELHESQHASSQPQLGSAAQPQAGSAAQPQLGSTSQPQPPLPKNAFASPARHSAMATPSVDSR
jgi:hypothetical protein